MKNLLLLLTIVFSLYSCDTEQIIITNSLTKVHFLDENNGWVIGNHGMMYETKNSGISWNKIELNTDVELSDLYFTDKNIGYLIGERGLLVKTTNGGSSFERYEALGSSNFLRDISFLNSDKGLITGTNGSIYLTEDAGQTWEDKSFFIGQTLIEEDIRAGAIRNENEIWLVSNYSSTVYDSLGKAFATTFIMLYKSMDGGDSWQEMIERNDLTHNSSLAFDMKINGDYLYVASDYQIIRINLETSLNTIDMFVYDVYYDINRRNFERSMSFKGLAFKNDEVWAAGSYGTNKSAVYNTLDNGVSWNLQFITEKDSIDAEAGIPSKNEFMYIRDIEYVNGLNSRFIAVGGKGYKILTSFDGENWESMILD